MFKRVSAVLGVATLVMAGCNESPTQPSDAPCDDFLLSYGATTSDTVDGLAGVRYIEVEMGTGATAVTGSSVTTVNYTGYYADPLGSKFQSSCDPNYSTFGFHVGSGLISGGGGFYALEGFSYGVLGMKTGGVRRVIIPDSMAYGTVEQNPNHEFAGKDLIFDIHLVGIR